MFNLKEASASTRSASNAPAATASWTPTPSPCSRPSSTARAAKSRWSRMRAPKSIQTQAVSLPRMKKVAQGKQIFCKDNQGMPKRLLSEKFA